MATQQKSVVTAERFAQGQTYADWCQAIDRNQARFVENYEGTHVSEEDAAALRALVALPNGPARCLALGEPWCPDVFRGLPVMARVAEASGMDLRVFFRDQHKDIMAEFLHNGEFESIPTFVFYTRDMQYIAHWIERPQQAKDEMHQLRAINEPLRNPDITPDERQKAIQAYVDFQHGPVWAGWRDATVREIRALLESRCQ
jgi:hypothetical protein